MNCFKMKAAQMERDRSFIAMRIIARRGAAVKACASVLKSSKPSFDGAKTNITAKFAKIN